MNLRSRLAVLSLVTYSFYLFPPCVQAQVEDVSDTSRVLVISGTPSWGYRLLQRELQRNPDVSLSCWLQTQPADRPQEGDERLESFPHANTLADFDAIILLDPDPEDLTDEWINALKQAGSYGTGILYVAGPQHSTRLLAGEPSGLAEILPVSIAETDASERAEYSVGRLGVVPEHAEHPLLQLMPDVDNSLEAWNSLTPVGWGVEVSEVRPEAQVLLRFPDGNPVLVVDEREDRKLVFMGMSQTWRWRQVGERGELFRSFWKSTINYLVRTEE